MKRQSLASFFSSSTILMAVPAHHSHIINTPPLRVETPCHSLPVLIWKTFAGPKNYLETKIDPKN
jgi:hypothetical protein